MSKNTTALRLTALVVTAAIVAGCSSNPKTLKAPCGPVAGMTDPCGEREPINTHAVIDFDRAPIVPV